MPDFPVVANIKDFGARGDGVTDDTAAFQRAVAEMPAGALWIPAGRYCLTGVVEITRSGRVLCGEGPDKTVIVCPRSLQEVKPLPRKAFGKSRYAFTGGFFTFRGDDAGGKMADVTRAARRGDRVLTVSSTDGIKTGDRVRLQMNDEGSRLGRHLHAEVMEAAETTRKEMTPMVSWVAAVKSARDGKIVLDRPLRLDVRPEWQAEIFSYAPTLSESGLENLRIEFPGRPKKPHLLEEGFNAIHFVGASDCWVRNVVICDADNGVTVGGFSRFCTVEKVVFEAARRKEPAGHHALWATGGSQDCLFQDFEVRTIYLHDLTVEGRANGNVFRRGRGVALNFDHHRNAPYENLFSQIDVGQARRVWTSSGRGDRGPHAGARETFWNVSGAGNFPPVPNWPQMNVVGVPVKVPRRGSSDVWVEVQPAIHPPELLHAQRLILSQP